MNGEMTAGGGGGGLLSGGGAVWTPPSAPPPPLQTQSCDPNADAQHGLLRPQRLQGCTNAWGGAGGAQLRDPPINPIETPPINPIGTPPITPPPTTPS